MQRDREYVCGYLHQDLRASGKLADLNLATRCADNRLFVSQIIRSASASLVDKVFPPFDPKAGDPKPMNSNPGIKTQESKSMNPSPETQTCESTSRHKRLSPNPGGFADRVFPAFEPQRQES